MPNTPLGLWGGLELTVALNTNLFLNGSTTRWAFVFQAPETGNIRKIWWRLASVTTAQPIQLSLQDPSTTTGYPDGIVDQSVVRASPAANVWYGDTLNADRAVTSGDEVALVMEWSGTAGDANILMNAASMLMSTYSCTYTSGAWSKGLAGTNRGFCGMIEYSTGAIYPIIGCHPGLSTNLDFSNATTYREVGMIFTPQETRAVRGIIVDGRLSGNGSIVIYESDLTTVKANIPFFAAQTFGTTANPCQVWFPTVVTLNSGSQYGVVVKPSTSTTCRVNWWDLPSAAARAACHFGFGSDGWLLQKNNAGTWVQTNTSKPNLVFLSDNGGGSGGSSIKFPTSGAA